MKWGFLSAVIALCAALAMPAAAQEAVSGPGMDVTKPSISETDAAKIEWYRQFAQPKPADTHSVWQAAPTAEFSMQFGGNNRWQLSLDKLSRNGFSPLPREEMQAGATFRITPRLSVGGEVSVGADELNDASTWESREVETGIRLKSAYKF